MTKALTIMAQYLQALGPEVQEKHKMPKSRTNYHQAVTQLQILDVSLRNAIGKAEDIEDLRVGLCSHQAILERERDAKGLDPEKHCRKCGIEMVPGTAHFNDYLVLRNKFCRGPICLDCVKRGGDVFHIAFKKGVDALRGGKIDFGL